MLPLSVLTLALLGGFVFTSQWYPTRYYALRSDGYRLIFAAAIAGVVFLFLATVLISVAIAFPVGQAIWNVWYWVVPLQDSGKATLAFLFGVSLWLPLNLLGRRFDLLSDGASVEREIRRKQNPLEVLFRQALGSRRTISVTVKNGKVYIGRLQTTFNPAFGAEAIGLILSHSGHRDDTQKMTIDIHYNETHKAIREGLVTRLKDELMEALNENPNAGNTELLAIARRRVSEEASIRNFEIVIPVAEVQSVNFFDKAIYDRFFAPKAEQTDSNAD